MKKTTLQRLWLVAGSLALGLVIWIFATYQLMLSTASQNIDKVVDATLQELQTQYSWSMSDEAIAKLKDAAKKNVKKVLFECDGCRELPTKK